jgi:2-C-methyl-D-erythritol 2,4-cyclodiphosphate synthase
MRIGQGYDVHKLVEGRPLILGGVTIPYKKGLLGHSDADVLVHAIMDAILGALALGDIGQHFPDTDTMYKGVDSMRLLKHVSSLMFQQGYKLGNIDSTICAQKPKLKDYIPQMRKRIAEIIGCRVDQVSVKATTEEKMGISGSGDGMTAHAIVLLLEDK